VVFAAFAAATVVLAVVLALLVAFALVGTGEAGSARGEDEGENREGVAKSG